MEVIMGKKTFKITRSKLQELISTYAGVIIDIGTGNGKFVYKSAQVHPEFFYIGIDSSCENLKKYSAKIYKKPSRGGLLNVLYVIANVKDLPQELNGLAKKIYINFPWGSLLRSLVQKDQEILENIIRISSRIGILEVLINYSVFSNSAQVEKLGLPMLTIDYVENELSPAYNKAGIVIVEKKILDKDEMKNIPTMWAKKLAYGREFRTLYIRAKIKK